MDAPPMNAPHAVARSTPVSRARRGRWRASVMALLVLLGVVASSASLLILTGAAQDAHKLRTLQPWLLAGNLLAVMVLLLLISRKLYALVRDYRAHAPGSRLKARTVQMFSLLALAPILVTYFFSVNAINRGIDSWFDSKVSTGLEDALALSRAALSLRMREFGAHTTALASDLHSVSDYEMMSQLDRYRRIAGASELIVVSDGGRIIAASTDFASATLPALPAPEVLLQARQRQGYVSLDPAPGGGYRVIAAMPVGNGGNGETRLLVASYPVPEQLAGLADGVRAAYAQYGQHVYQRPYLKSTFTLTLTIVLLLSALGAVYGAFFWATRLVKPVQDLIEGTRAVGQGDLDLKLALPSNDELGYLVGSFNDMTKRLARARSDAEANRAAVEQERARLAVILARLSTGVISVDADFNLRTANQAASNILGVDLEAAVGSPLSTLADSEPSVAQFVSACSQHLAAGDRDWREPVPLITEHGRRELMVASTTLPADDGASAGLVIVFDDISTLLQAQRDAAWGEVARRLAHEIKNPLTPIQLSADRMRRRLLSQLDAKDAEILERGTHTIVQQVEAMRQMVNAFSEYARAPSLDLVPIDINQLVSEVTDLYRSHGSAVSSATPVSVRLELDPEAGMVLADRGRLRQVLNNLLTNAFEALEGQADAVVSIETHDVAIDGHSLVELVVVDNGPGFQSVTGGQMFDPYVTSKPKGTGLGLAIVKKIIDEHGGSIEAENTPEGGARVRALLPRDEAARGIFSMTGSRDLRRSEFRREHV